MRILLIVLGVYLFLSVTAIHEASAAEIAFCKDPMKFICNVKSEKKKKEALAVCKNNPNPLKCVDTMTKAVFPKVKEAFNDVRKIVRSIYTSLGFTQEDFITFDSVQVEEFTAFINNEYTSDEDAQQLQTLCGEKFSTLKDNATNYSNSTIVLCPLNIMMAIKAGKIKDFLFSTFAHELGHMITKKTHYKKLRACIAKNMTKGLEKPKRRKLSKRIDKHIEEIASDLVASLAIAKYMKKMRYKPRQAKIILESKADYCTYPGDGVHPPGKYRIVNLVRRVPEMHKALGCKIRRGAKIKSCTFKGESKPLY